MKLSEDMQADIIANACKDAGLDTHIKWVKYHKDSATWAEKIADRFRGSRIMPVKNSYMFCDTLDMCFFFDSRGYACMTYAGYAYAGSRDITTNLGAAFEKAEKVLASMQKAATESSNQNGGT